MGEFDEKLCLYFLLEVYMIDIVVNNITRYNKKIVNYIQIINNVIYILASKGGKNGK